MKALTKFQAKVLKDVEENEPTTCLQVAQRLDQRNTGQTRVALRSLARVSLVERIPHEGVQPALYRLTPKGAGWVQPRHSSRDSWLEEGLAAGWITAEQVDVLEFDGQVP